MELKILFFLDGDGKTALRVWCYSMEPSLHEKNNANRKRTVASNKAIPGLKIVEHEKD